MNETADTTRRRGGGSWTAFLCVGFAVVGLVGVFAVYAAQLPLQRGFEHDAAIAAIGTGSADQARLHEVLGTDYDRIVQAPGPLADRLLTARAASRDQFLAEAADIKRRLLIVVGVVTAAAALFGAMVLSVARNAR